jgi:hypothetical protein
MNRQALRAHEVRTFRPETWCQRVGTCTRKTGLSEQIRIGQLRVAQ